MLRLPDRWLWDFWLAQDGGDFHLFYLQAPRSLQREELRHWNVSIGHAVSQDLRSWQVLPDALRPSPADSPAWDNYTTWTGSVVHHGALWYLFYTGSNRAEDGLIQRIGLATSKDLVRWEKHPASPLIEADPQWYELLDLAVWNDQAWRDPWVFQHPESGDFHVLITARAKQGSPDERGVIGHARSQDLINWQVLPPLTTPSEFGQMEVPQLVGVASHYYLIFSATTQDWSARRRKRTGLSPVMGTHYLVADQPLGPFRNLADEFLVGDLTGSFYSGKLVQGPGGVWYLLASSHYRPDGSFSGELADPWPVEVQQDGRLQLNRH